MCLYHNRVDLLTVTWSSSSGWPELGSSSQRCKGQENPSLVLPYLDAGSYSTAGLVKSGVEESCFGTC